MDDLFSRGVAYTVPDTSALKRAVARKGLRIKYGIDPTTAELHLGYFTIFRRLKKLQAKGNTAVVVLGTFTGRFGDPTGKREARPLRDAAEVEEKARKLARQLKRVLAPERCEIVRNHRWFDRMPLDAFLRMASRVTVAQLRERDLFEEREKRGGEIFAHEFLYPVLQAYDSVAIRSDLTIIGSDQLFNELLARKLQQKMGQKPQGIIALNILPGTDGKQKMSQSFGNTIGLFEAADEQFGKLMSLPDSAVMPYAELLTDLPLPPLRKALRKGGAAMRDAKMRVASFVVGELAGSKKATAAKEAFILRFRKRAIPKNIATLRVSSRDILSVIVEAGFAVSRGDARRLIVQRGVRVNGSVVSEEKFVVPDGSTLSVGKRKIAHIRRV